MIKWLNYHHLLYFRVIATEGSIVKASEKLKVGQPALSAQLKQLEESLGKDLFRREKRSLILTDAGKVALQYAEEIFQKGEEFIQVFNEEAMSLNEVYRIGVVDSAPKLLTCKIAEFAQKVGTNCSVNLSEGSPQELVSTLEKHELDIVLTNNTSVITDIDVEMNSLGSSPIAVYGAEKFEKLKKDFPKSISGKPLILPSKHSTLRYDIEHKLKELKLKYKLVAEVQDSSVKKLMAEHGKGLVFLPEFAAKGLVKEGKLIKIGRVEDLVEHYWLVTKKRTIRSKITEEILESFKL